MPTNALIATDPIVSQNFYLEIDDAPIVLSGVSGLDCEVEVVTTRQVGPTGKMEEVKTRGTETKAGDLTLTRLAPSDSTADPLWKWFRKVRDEGFKGTDRSDNRKNGSIVLYDTAMKEVGRFNFFQAWPYKISTDAPGADSNDALKETITLAVERLDRIK